MASTKIFNIDGRNLRTDAHGLSDNLAEALASAQALHAELWGEQDNETRLCATCGDPLVKGFAHTAGCSALWAIWPL